MGNLIANIRARAKKNIKTIVLPEGSDERIVRAAEIITKEKIANIILLGDETKIKADFKKVNLDGIKVVNPKTLDIDKYAENLLALRRHKGMIKDEAYALARDEMHLGMLMVESGEADGLVGGVLYSTANMLRPGLQIIKTAPGIKTVSSCFIIVLPKGVKYGQDGILVFGDCSVNVSPDSNQLADIAIASAQSARIFAQIKDPKVAMLSFSTKCSAQHELVDKVNAAVAIVKSKEPDLCIDGDLQLDAAIEPLVAVKKAPKSGVAGKANVLIFPDLQSGNIGYKLVERLAGAKAIGPICQGFNKPLNDLSRGCGIEDIVSVVAITALQADSFKKQ